MKKLIAILMLAVMLVGCGASSESDAIDGEKSNQKRFVSVEKRSWAYEIMVDRETRVMYVVSDGSYNHGTFTVMVDENGKPLTWEGDLE